MESSAHNRVLDLATMIDTYVTQSRDVFCTCIIAKEGSLLALEAILEALCYEVKRDAPPIQDKDYHKVILTTSTDDICFDVSHQEGSRLIFIPKEHPIQDAMRLVDSLGHGKYVLVNYDS